MICSAALVCACKQAKKKKSYWISHKLADHCVSKPHMFFFQFWYPSMLCNSTDYEVYLSCLLFPLLKLLWFDLYWETTGYPEIHIQSKVLWYFSPTYTRNRLKVPFVSFLKHPSANLLLHLILTAKNVG